MSDFIFNFIPAHLPWFWLALMILFVIIEAATFSLTTIWAALASLVMIALAKTGLPFRWQLLIFLFITIALILFTRPFAVKKLKLGKDATNVNTMEGQEVLVTKKISQFEKGQVKASNGVLWTAAGEENIEIPPKSVCLVTGVQGNTLIVKVKE